MRVGYLESLLVEALNHGELEVLGLAVLAAEVHGQLGHLLAARLGRLRALRVGPRRGLAQPPVPAPMLLLDATSRYTTLVHNTLAGFWRPLPRTSAVHV